MITYYHHDMVNLDLVFMTRLGSISKNYEIVMCLYTEASKRYGLLLPIYRSYSNFAFHCFLLLAIQIQM